MKNRILFAAFLIISLSCIFSACADKLPEFAPLDCSITPVTYNGSVKGILDVKCNTSGCHDDNAQSTLGAYSTLNDARKQDIYNRVYVTKNMPPSGMDFQRVDSIRCWSENGYLEN
ncbi:MAG: hypothetical protein ACI976_000479 [Aureispira sp.]|jgi:hypothetical protein